MKHIITLFLLAISLTTNAQCSFYGRVTGVDGEGLHGCQVILSANGNISAFASADENGKFIISNIRTGKFHINISCIGYKSFENDIEIKNNYEENFILMSDTIMVEGITVTKERTRKTATGHTYFLSEKARKSKNPYKALQEIPEIVSDYIHQSVKSADGKQMIVLIDGAIVNTGINPIDPERIASIEIHDVISAKYMRTGAGRIMNIKLKKQKENYTYIESFIRNDMPSFSGFTGIIFEFGNPKISIYGDISPGYSHNNKTYTGNETYTKDYIRTEYENRWSCAKNIDYEMMLKYRPTPKDYIALYIQGEAGKSHTKGEGTGTLSTMDNKDYSKNMYSKNLARNFSVATYYKHIFSTSIETETTARLSTNLTDDTEHTEQRFGQEKSNEYINLSVRQHAFELSSDFTWNITDDIVLNGGNSTNYETNRLQDRVATFNDYRHRNWNEYLYAGITGNLGDFDFMLSGGYEWTWMHSAGIFNKFSRPRISASIGYDFHKRGSISARYSQNISNPSISLLNPYNTSTDPLIHTSGNPYLLPQKKRDITASYNFRSNIINGGLNATYSQITDMFEPYAYIDDNSIYHSTYTNGGHFHALDITLYTSFSHKNTYINCNITHHTDFYIGLKAKKSIIIRASGMQTFGKFGATMSLSHTSRSYSTISTIKSILPIASISLSYNFTPNIMISAGAISVLGNIKTKTYTKVEGYEQIAATKAYDLRPWLMFRWTIRKNYKRKINLENDIMLDKRDKIKL